MQHVGELPCLYAEALVIIIREISGTLLVPRISEISDKPVSILTSHAFNAEHTAISREKQRLPGEWATRTWIPPEKSSRDYHLEVGTSTDPAHMKNFLIHTER